VGIHLPAGILPDCSAQRFSPHPAKGEPRRITKREAVVTQLVNKSTTADLRATTMLIDMLKEVDRKVVEQFVPRLRRQIAAETAEAAAAAEPPG
jgi:hypothetical protein